MTQALQMQTALWVSATSKWEGGCEYAGDKQGTETNNVFVMHNAPPGLPAAFNSSALC